LLQAPDGDDLSGRRQRDDRPIEIVMLPMTGSRRARTGTVIAILLLLLLAGGLFALGVSRDGAISGDRFVRTLDLTERTIDAERSAARVQAQLARLIVRSADSASPAAALDDELRQLAAAVGALQTQLKAMRSAGAAEPSNAELARAEAAAAQLQARVSDLERTARQPDATVFRARLVELTDRQMREIDKFLAGVLATRRGQLDAAAEQVRRTDRISHASVFAAGALAVVLGVLVTGVAWRSLSANAQLMQQLSQLAREDGLTGVANRRTLDERLPQEMARARRQKASLSVVMIDLDHFKRFNDRRGHAAGDALLRNAAQAWLRQLRPTDLLARYGGEEFTLVLPGCDELQAEHMVERLQPLVPEKQTFSAGIATWNEFDNPQELLAAADRALLQAKRGGRNRIVVSGREPQISLPLKLA
jgi:diguanylate cyclase (GGDEF)-like protein